MQKHDVLWNVWIYSYIATEEAKAASTHFDRLPKLRILPLQRPLPLLVPLRLQLVLLLDEVVDLIDVVYATDS